MKGILGFSQQITLRSMNSYLDGVRMRSSMAMSRTSQRVRTQILVQ